jgi:hypothetical protein
MIIQAWTLGLKIIVNKLKRIKIDQIDRLKVKNKQDSSTTKS